MNFNNWCSYGMVLCCTFLTTISSNPLETVVDITNDFSICILQLIASPRTNAVFSPYGLTSVVVLIHEGANSSSSSAQQIRQALKMPNNSDLTQLGFRDLHRYLKSYFTSDGFLRGLILSNPKAVLSQDYLKTLKYYGFEPDISIEQLNVRESPVTTKIPQSSNNNNTVLQIPVKNTTNIRQKDKTKEPIQEKTPSKSENTTKKIIDSNLELTTINPTTCKDGLSNDGETVCPTMETPLNLPTQINFSTTENDIPESKTTTESTTRDIEPTTINYGDETTTKTSTTVIKKSTIYPKTDSTNFNEILETSSSGTQSTIYIEPKTIEIQNNTFNEITTENIIPNSEEVSTEYILGEFTLSEPVHSPIPSFTITTPKTIEPHEDGFYHEDEEYDDIKNKLDQIPSWKTSENLDENILMTTSIIPTLETLPTIFINEDSITTTESTIPEIITEIHNDGNNFTEIIKNFDSTNLKEELNDDSKLLENQFNNFKNIEDNYEILNEFKTDQTVSEIIETTDNLTVETTTEIYEKPIITTTEISLKGLEIDVNRTSKSLDHDEDDDKKSRDDDFERNLNLLFEDINKILNSSKPFNNSFDNEILNVFPKENLTDSKESSNDLIKLFNSTPNSETESIELLSQTTQKTKNDFVLNENDTDDDDEDEDLIFSEANDSLIDTSELMKLFNFNFDDFKNYDFDDHEYISKNDNNNHKNDEDTENLTTREKRSIQDSRFRMANWLEENRYNQSPTTQWFTSFTNKQLVPMLTVKAFLPFADIPSMDAQAIQIPLDVDYYTMLIVLPKTRMGLKQLLYSLQWCSIREIIASLRTTPIYAEIPTFTMVHHVNLVEPLIKLGVRDIFSPKTAQLTVMSKDPNLFVRSVEQIVTISVREHYNNNNQHRWYDATESQIQQHFLATHPFVFFVVDTETKVSLVAGTIVDPTLRSTGM